MGILKRIIGIFANLCYVGISVYLLVALPILFGYKPLVVLSGSMEPTYKTGAIIYYEASNDIKKGDVIVFESGDDSFVTHRVDNIVDNKYVTKGDANETVDAELIEIQSIKGKAINFSIPYLGYYIQFVNINLWLIGIVVFILVSEFLVSNLKTFDIDSRKGKGEENEK